MKRIARLALAFLLLLSLIGCTAQNSLNEGPASDGSPTVGSYSDGNAGGMEDNALEPILQSYYRGQEDRAYDMLQKKIFQSMLESWTTEHIGTLTNPTWLFDTFTQYHRLDAALAPLPESDPLYACAFSADEGRFGFIVVSYNGDGMSQVSVSETPYLYDLRADLAELKAQLEDSGLDLATAVASRVSIWNAEDATSQEGILIEDITGQQVLYEFDAAPEE